MSKYLPLKTILSLTVTLIGCGPSIAQHPTLPTGWAEHKDAAGFSVDLPKGWIAETAKDRHLMFKSGDGSEFAYALPFQSPNGGSAAEWIKPIVQHLNALLPNAEIVQTRQVAGSAADQAVAKITFSRNGTALQANALCSIANGKGVFYAIAAPEQSFVAQRETLCRVLASVSTAGSAPNSSASGASSAPGELSYVAWTDPIEHAFTTQVPQGWKVTGGIFRAAPVDVRPQVNVGAEDGQIFMQFGDAKLGAFVGPGPSSKMRGLSEGGSYTVNGITYVVMTPMSGVQFARAYIERGIAKKLSGVKLMGSRDLPNESTQNGQVSVTCGEAEFTFTRNGVQMTGVCHAKVAVWGQGPGQMWTATPNTIFASPERMATAKTVAETMIKSTVEDQQWAAQLQQTTAEFNRLVIQNHEAAMKQLHDLYVKYSASMDENQRQWSNIINGTTDVRNTATGETAKAMGNYDYYFQAGGKRVGNNSGFLPGPDFSQLQKF